LGYRRPQFQGAVSGPYVVFFDAANPKHKNLCDCSSFAGLFRMARSADLLVDADFGTCVKANMQSQKVDVSEMQDVQYGT
jgi:hypothetical protein